MEKGQGKILRSFLRSSDISIEDFCLKLGISRQTLYNWFEKSTLDDFILKKVENSGIVQMSIFTPVNGANEYQNKSMEVLQNTVEMLERLVESKDREINTLHDMIYILKGEKPQEGNSSKRKAG